MHGKMSTWKPSSKCTRRAILERLSRLERSRMCANFPMLLQSAPNLRGNRAGAHGPPIIRRARPRIHEPKRTGRRPQGRHGKLCKTPGGGGEDTVSPAPGPPEKEMVRHLRSHDALLAAEPYRKNTLRNQPSVRHLHLSSPA